MTINQKCSTRNAKFSYNDEAAQAFCLAPPSVTYCCTAAISTDPFASKTNKYAESKVIRVTTIAKQYHIKFGDENIGAATDQDAAIPADATEYFVVDCDYPYVRVIDHGEAGTIYISEIY